MNLFSRAFRAAVPALAGLVVFAGTVAAQDLTKVLVAQSSKSMNFVPMYVAEHAGFFKDEGLAVEVILSGGGPKAMTALISGSVDISVSVLSDGINAHRKGLKDVKAIASLLNGYPSALTINAAVAKKAGITPQSPLAARIAALKGLRIGITTPGSFSDLLVRQLALTHGMNPDTDLQIVPVGGFDTGLAAFRAGKIDACACIPPADIMLMNEGAGMALVDPATDLASMRDVPVAVAYTTTSIIAKKRPAVEAFIRAITRAEALIGRDRAAAETATRAGLNQLSPDMFTAIWPVFSPLVATNPEITASGFDKELDFQKAALPASQATSVPYADAVDMSFVNAAKASADKPVSRK